MLISYFTGNLINASDLWTIYKSTDKSIMTVVREKGHCTVIYM